MPCYGISSKAFLAILTNSFCFFHFIFLVFHSFAGGIPLWSVYVSLARKGAPREAIQIIPPFPQGLPLSAYSYLLHSGRHSQSQTLSCSSLQGPCQGRTPGGLAAVYLSSEN